MSHRPQGFTPTSSQRRRHQISRRALVVRALRTRWWPRFLFAGVALAVAGIALLSGPAQAATGFFGALVALFALIRGLDSDDYYRHEPPVPPGAPGGV